MRNLDEKTAHSISEYTRPRFKDTPCFCFRVFNAGKCLYESRATNSPSPAVVYVKRRAFAAVCDHETVLFETYETRLFEGRNYCCCTQIRAYHVLNFPLPIKRERVQHDLQNVMCTEVHWCCYGFLLLRRCPRGEHHARSWSSYTIQAQATCNIETKQNHQHSGRHYLIKCR